MILLVVAGVAAGSVAIRIGALQRRAIDEAGMFVPEPKAASMETARVLGSIQQLKLVTVELATHVNSESAEESWRGDVRARVDAPVKLHFGTDLSRLEADQVRRSPLGDQWVVTIPPPQRVATEVFGEREQTDVSVGWLRSRSMSGEKHLGLARRDLYEAARRLELSEKDMLRVRSETREQMGKLMRTIVGPWAGVTVRFTDEVEAAPGVRERRCENERGEAVIHVGMEADVVEVIAEPKEGGRRRRGVVGWARTGWRCRWNVVRLSAAVFLLWVMAADTGSRLARLQLMALPDFDYIGEVRYLREAGRFGEAIVVADAGLEELRGEAQIEVLREKQRTIDARDSFMRRLKDVGMGALTGSAGEEGQASLERLGGALAADLFVVGDVRDLIIQGGKYITGGDPDGVIVALSATGLVTTLAPEIDWAPALMKIAKKASALSKGMEEYIVTAVKSRRFKEAEVVLADVGTMAQHASPAGAVRMLKYADAPADAARMARFVEKYQKGSRGAFAMHVTGKEGAGLLKRGEALGAEGAAAAERLVLDASKKGPAGVKWLKGERAASLLKPHALLGIGKGLWKGNVADAIRRFVEETRGVAWWLLPLSAGWVVLELGLMGRKVLRGGRGYAHPAKKAFM